MPIDQVSTNKKKKASPSSFVFIVTYGRSGSTLLQSLLNGIDGYCIRGENGGVLPHLSRVYHDLQDARPLSGIRASKIPTPVDHPWFGGECIDLEGLAQSLCGSFTDTVLSLPEDTRVGGFKEIRYHTLGEYLGRHLDFISQFFPNSKFIFNRRNLKSVAKSGWWREQDAQEVIRKLSAADERFQKYAETNCDSCIVMDYDTYKDQPAALKPLYEFLGETFDHDRAARILEKRLTHLQANDQPLAGKL